MLKSFKTDKKIGTLGARLHFEDNTIQHNGVLLYINQSNSLNVTHIFLKNYHNFNLGRKVVFGNTAGLMMVKKKLFDEIGGFNEEYLSCFEDVEFNLECLKRGYINYCDGDLVSYHYESQTRKNSDIINLTNLDFKDRLFPLLKENIDLIYKYIIKV
jgi:GT2 family glycosyltransferase